MTRLDFIKVQISRIKLIQNNDCTLGLAFDACGVFWLTGSRLRLKRDATAILRLLEQQYGLGKGSWNLRSFELRQPYLLLLHFMQIEALKRLRANPERPELDQILMMVLAGVASGLRKTG